MASGETNTSFAVEERSDGNTSREPGFGATRAMKHDLFAVLPEKRIDTFLAMASSPRCAVVGFFCLTDYYARVVTANRSSREEITAIIALAATLKTQREWLGKPELTIYATTPEKYNSEKGNYKFNMMNGHTIDGVVAVEAPLVLQSDWLGYITYLAYDRSSEQQRTTIDATIASVVASPANLPEGWHQYRGSGSTSRAPWVQQTRTQTPEPAIQDIVSEMANMALRPRGPKRQAP